MKTGRLCEVSTCWRPRHSGARLCAGHAKRQERGGDLELEVLIHERLPLQERCAELARRLVNADDDVEYERAGDALKHALADAREQRGFKGIAPEIRALQRISIHAERDKWSEALERVAQGKRLVLTRSGIPIAGIVSLAELHLLDNARRGGMARSQSLSASKRHALARSAARARWKKQVVAK